MDVVFFPRNDYPNNVEVCYHRLGKKMTYTEATTEFKWWSVKYLLPYALQKGIKSSWAPDYNTIGNAPITPAIKELVATGQIWSDIYSGYVSDYSEAFVKNLYRTKLLPFFYENFGKKPVNIIYSQGITAYASYMEEFFLSGVCNPYNHQTDYGSGCGNPSNIPYNHHNYMTRVMTFRIQSEASIVYPNMENMTEAIEMVSDKIDETLALPNGGWVYNMSHWHDVVSNDIDIETDTPKEGHEDLPTIQKYKDYLDMVAAKNVNNEIYFAGLGEAIAYLAYRESISKAVMYSPTGYENSRLVIRLEAKNVFNVDTDLLQIPISVRFSTVGTPLEGQTIRCNYNLISLGSNQYIVEIPWSEYPGALIERVVL